MKHSIILLILLLFSIAAFPQIIISGSVVDKDTSLPIANVVIYSSDYRYSTMTDEAGYYKLSTDSIGIIHFEQLAYHPFSVSVDSLSTNPQVHLERNIYELEAVEISPVDAEELLGKAIRNLHANEEKKKTRSYLCHIRENTTNEGEREAYALFNATLKKLNKKTGKYDWDFRLMELDKLKDENSSLFYIKKRPFPIELFPQEFTTKSDLNNFICELQDKNDSVLIMKLSPKMKDKKRYKYAIYTINKVDSVLIKIESQSLPNSIDFTAKTYRGVDYQTVNHHFEIQYTQDEQTNLYYLDTMEHLGTVRISSKESSYDLSFDETVTSIEETETHSKTDQKKIKPYNYILYEIDFPETEGFWKDYLEYTFASRNRRPFADEIHKVNTRRGIRNPYQLQQ